MKQPSCIDIFEPGLLSIEEVKERILRQIAPVAVSEKVPLPRAVNRVLAEAVISSFNVPPHTNAAVDGYALHHEDLPKGRSVRLKVVGLARAGHPFSRKLQRGEAVQIMTGAPMPEGADTVVMQEQVEREGEVLILEGRFKAGENVRKAGEDLAEGEAIFSAGRRLRPPDIGILASIGRVELLAYRKPRIALLSTGDEVLQPGTPHQEGKIYDSNRFSLHALLTKLPVEVIDFGIIPDDLEKLKETFQMAAQRADVILSSAGVSVGEADYTKQVLQEVGDIRFWKLAIKPGRPFAFGKVGEALFFGLPGNPVAVLVTYLILVLPALKKLCGITDDLPLITYRAKTLERLRKKAGRTEYQRGILVEREDGLWVKTTGKQGSGILRSMSLANCLILLEHDRGPVKEGEEVTVLPLATVF